MDAKRYCVTILFLSVLSYIDAALSDHLQFNSSRYGDCGRYTCPDGEKFKFLPDTQYKYEYTLSINSTFDKKEDTHSTLTLHFKMDIRIENCEGILQVQRDEEKAGLSVFEEDTNDEIYEEVSRSSLRFSFYDGSILNVCPDGEESITALNIKKGILSAFQNRMKRFDIDKFTSERDINGFCPTSYNLQRINGTTLVIRKIKDIANCLERCQLHSIIPTSKFIFQSRFHKWTPLNSTVICNQTIDHSIPVHIRCLEEHMLKILPNQTHSSRTLISQEFKLLDESYAGYFSPPEIFTRDDLSFNHKKPKKSEISELEDSEALLNLLCNITSTEFQVDAADTFAKFIHTARHLSSDALEMLFDTSGSMCSNGRKHVEDSLPFLRSTAALSLMKKLIVDGSVPESISNKWMFAMSLFPRPDNEVIESVSPMLMDGRASDEVLLSVSSIFHSYNVWSSETDDKDLAIATIMQLEITLNETVVRGENPHKLVVLLKALGNAGIQTESIAYTLASCIRNPTTPPNVKIAAIEAHRRLPCGFNTRFLLEVYTETEFDAEVRISAYIQLMKCPSYTTVRTVKVMLQTESCNQVGSYVWSHIQNVLKSSLRHQIPLQALLQDQTLQKKFNTDFRKFSRNYENAFYLSEYDVGGVVTGNVIFSSKTYIPTYLNFNLTVDVFGEIINVLEINVFVEGLERYAEKLFRGGTDFLTNKIDKIISPYRFLREIPMSINEKIKFFFKHMFGNFPEPTVSIGMRLFGNEFAYTSCSGQDQIRELLEELDIENIFKRFLDGQEVKHDRSTVFMDMSYVSPTGAGVPLNLDVVGISITHVDASILMNFTDFSAQDRVLIKGKFKPRFSINFEGSMGTDLVYRNTQIQVRNKIYTSSEIEGQLLADTIDNVTLSFDLPQNRFDLFSIQSDLYYRNASRRTDVLLQTIPDMADNSTCVWPLLEQALGLKMCTTYYSLEPEMLLQSLVHALKGPFKFSLYLEKMDPTAVTYILKYNKKISKGNGSISIEFETPHSKIPRNMITTLRLSPEDNKLNISLRFNETNLEANGVYRNTPNDKILKFEVDINGLRQVDLIAELHIKKEKKLTFYSPKLYFAISSKPVAELTGTYRWLEKTGIASGELSLHFKTNKFDSLINGTVTLLSDSMTCNLRINYKFEKAENESLKLDFKVKDLSTKLKTTLLSAVQIESSSYADMNLGFQVKFQKSHDHLDMRFNYVSSPFEENDSKKLKAHGQFSYGKSFNGLKTGVIIEVKKPVTDLNFRLELGYQHSPTTTDALALVRYAKDREIVIRLEIFSPQTQLLHYEIKLNATLPSTSKPAVVHIRILEKTEKEYDIDFTGTWFSGHSAMAQGVLQDKSTHFGNNYVIKIQVRSRLFNEVSLHARILFNDLERKAVINANHNAIKYALTVKHSSEHKDIHDTLIEYMYDNNTYAMKNHLNMDRKVMQLDLHLDKYRDVRILGTGRLESWNSNVGLEVQWDVNRDPYQKIVISFATKAVESAVLNQYEGRSALEYPGHVTAASFVFQHRGTYKSISLNLEMNPSSVIVLEVYNQNELFTNGSMRLGFRLMTPFENWKETSFSSGLYCERQSFQLDSNLNWQSDQKIILSTHGGYKFDENVTSLTFSSLLNSTLQDLSVLAFNMNYTGVRNAVHLSFLLQPNAKYSLYVSTSGMIRRYATATEYLFHVRTKTPFLEYSDNEFGCALKFMTENRIIGNTSLRLSDLVYSLFVKGYVDPFERSKVCFHVRSPFKKFDDVHGLVFYDLDERHILFSFTKEHSQASANLMYRYHNVTNFNLRLEVTTPMTQFRNLALVTMYNGSDVEIRGALNTFNMGISGTQRFSSWTNLEYRVHVNTPIESFKESDATFKVYIVPNQKIVTARVILSNVTKVGFNFAYNSEANKNTYLDECDSMFEADTPGIPKETVLANGLFELDTLIYPTIFGRYQLDQKNNRYVLDAKLTVFFLKINVQNYLDFDSLASFNNSFALTSSIDMYSSIRATIAAKNTSNSKTHTAVSLEVTRFNEKYQGTVDVLYEYKSIYDTLLPIKNKIDGLHNINIKVKTPIARLEEGEITVVTQIENKVIQMAVKAATNTTTISLTGSFEYSYEYLNLNAALDVSSIYFNVPAFRLQILRDFYNLEKRVALVLRKEKMESEDFFCIRGSWIVESRDYVSVFGELITPVKILDDLKCKLLYSHDTEADAYKLEAAMKYSNKTEMKIAANLKAPTVTLNLESSMEGLRTAYFTGSVEQTGPGEQKIDASMVSDKSNYFRIVGSSLLTDLTPFSIKGRLLRGKDGIQISNVEMAIRKQLRGYNIIASLHSKGKSLSIQTEITDYPNEIRTIHAIINARKGDLEHMYIDAELKLQHPGIYIVTVKGDSTMKDVKGNVATTTEIWFRDGIGAIFATLDSGALKGNVEVFHVWKPPNFVYGTSKVDLIVQKEVTELFASKVYFIKQNQTFKNFTSGLLINLKDKWLFEANTTLVMNSSNHVQTATYFVMPDTKTYSLVGSVNCNDDYDVIQHLVVISRPVDIPCYTISDVNLAVEDIHGIFAFKCGMRDTLFMMDNFSGKKTANSLVLNNWLRSNTLTNALVTNVNHTKYKSVNTVNVKFFYPPNKRIALADIHFETTDNFDLFINTTTPYSKTPHFACEVISVTSKSVYHRSGQIYLQSKPAKIEIKHTKVPHAGNVLNDGKVLIAFPITTWHEGALSYVYTNSTVYINGTMELFYNSNRLINGTFTKNATKMRMKDRNFIHLKIGNALMPIGVNYIHEAAPHSSSSASHDFRRAEVFQLERHGGFNITGEATTEVIGTQESTLIKILHLNRSVAITSSTDGANVFGNGLFISLKPEIWFGCHLKTEKTVTNTSYQKVYELNLSYPRRNYTIISDLAYGEKHIKTQFILHNFQASPQKTIALSFDTKKVSPGLRETMAVLYHPSFRRNVTMFVSFHSMRSVLADIAIVLEYTKDEDRRFELAGRVDSESTRSNDRRYSWRIKGKHPATRLKLDVDGFFRSETGNHFMRNNISYDRSFLPEQFWNGKVLINMNDNIIEIERVSTRANILVHGDYRNASPKHIIRTRIIEGTENYVSANFEVDLEQKEVKSIVNLTADASDRVQIEGDMPENREAKLSIWRTFNEFNFPQLTFHVTLNHSRFLSSALIWRTDIGLDALKTTRKSASYLWRAAQDGLEFWTQFLRAEALETMITVWYDAKPEVEELIDDFHDFKSVHDNINYFKKIFNDSYNANEFLLQDIHRLYTHMARNMTLVSTLESVPKLLSELVESMGETSQVIKNSSIWVVNTITELYQQFLSILDELVEGKAEEYVARFIQRGSERFDSFIKDLQISFVSTLESALAEMLSVLSHYQRKLLLIFEPTFIEILHHIDSTFWSSSRKFIDFLYTKKNDLSPYLLRNSNVTRRLDAVYKDLIRNDFFTNVKKYTGLFFDVVYEYYLSQVPYREELSSVGNEIVNEVKELYKLPLVAYTVDNIKIMYDQVAWVYEYLDISGRLQRVIPFLYRQFQKSSSPALELQMKSQKPKTKFLFIPENGIIKFEQKLPFPWHAFNETPAYEELEEYKYLKRIQEFFATSKYRISSLYRMIFSLTNPTHWFPPFESQAQLVGFNNYITFDSIHVPFYGNSCQYLLSHDFAEGKFSLVVNTDENDSDQSISLFINKEQITIQFKPVRITTASRKLSKFPLQLNDTYVYFDHGIITVESPKGITLKCNSYYRLCSIKLSGWFFGKVSGLLGTMNNEPSDDVSKTKSSDREVHRWSLSPENMSCPATANVSMSPADYAAHEKCSKLFTSVVNNTSPLEPCFNEIDPSPFNEICALDPRDDNVCSVVMAYIQSCQSVSVPLRIPAFCISCSVNKRFVNEGTFIPLDGRSVPQSSDIVFIVEAKLCNENIVNRKNILLLINAISKELITSGLTNNRYSLVVFGGADIHDEPHSAIIDNSAHSFNTSHFVQFFENIPVGNGSSDVFAALRFASKLSFRLGVSKNFVLLLCSNCDPANMELDYSVLHHAMVEKSIVLHILMEENFPMTDKQKSGKVLFGLDSYTAYTKGDTKSDDRELYQKTKLTKSLLGYCTPLALESNGTLFTSKPLMDTRISKKFAAVFARRVALTAKTKDCQICECHADNDGIPYVECISCQYPTPINFDFELDEDDDDSSSALMNF